jgi:hypothetical protein
MRYATAHLSRTGRISCSWRETVTGSASPSRTGGKHLDPDAIAFDVSRDAHYGMFIIDRRSDGWGFSLDGIKGVWFVMDL